MAKTRRKSDQDIKIKRAARELGIAVATMRYLIDTVSDEELMEEAVRLVEAGRAPEKVARNLGVDEATLHHLVWWKRESCRMEERRRLEELRKRPPWLEDPPS